MSTFLSNFRQNSFKMKNYIILFIVILMTLSCTSKRIIYKKMKGEPLDVLTEEFGKPKSIIDNGNEKVYVFEVIKDLKSTPINQGRFTLDPMITPKVRKKETYLFTVINGIVTSSKLEEEYERIP